MRPRLRLKGMRRTLLTTAIASACLLGGVSCTTMYDAQGNPRQVVSPEGAALAAVAAGVIGYAIADDNDHHHHRKYKKYRHYGHGYRGGYGYGRYCR